jgi:malic enzyme
MSHTYLRWPNVLVQFEDFQNQRAVALLERYRKNRLCFNDDIQGTGAVAVAGILSSLRCKKLNFSDLASQRILIAGGGSAGMGVANALLEYLMVRCGLTKEEASKIFYICDNIGLLTEKRKSMSGYVMLPNQETYLRSEIEMEGMSILDTVKTVKPSILIGLSGVGGIFTTEVCEEMGKINEQPIIFPMSNPSDHAECSANVAFAATNGRAIFASGSPFNNVIMNGKTCFANQGNNMFIFPGLGLGCVVGKCNIVSNTMILTAAETLAATMSQSDIDQGMVYPDVSNIREVITTYIT